MSDAMSSRNTLGGARTRDAILQAAADVASVEGLEGLSIGHLAVEVGMSKSGLFAHFGSKEELQLATIEVARKRYVREVIAPAMKSDAGLAQLHALCESFLSYIERRVFPGGCFFAAAMAEFDAKTAGPVRARIAECQTMWMSSLEHAAEVAQHQRQLRSSVDPQQLAFQLEAAMLAANWYVLIFSDPAYLERARGSVQSLLAGDATPTGLRMLNALNDGDAPSTCQQSFDRAGRNGSR